MGMEQYRETFRKQQINGDILTDCDDDILQNELKITSRLHRIRLLRIISGQYSVQKIMSGDDGYVLMLPAKWPTVIFKYRFNVVFLYSHFEQFQCVLHHYDLQITTSIILEIVATCKFMWMLFCNAKTLLTLHCISTIWITEVFIACLIGTALNVTCLLLFIVVRMWCYVSTKLSLDACHCTCTTEIYCGTYSVINLTVINLLLSTMTVH